MSDDEYFDENDTYVSNNWVGSNTPLAGSESYTVERSINIRNTEPGEQYLLFVADRNNEQNETNETDNVYALPFTVTAPPNLTVTDTTTPEQGYIGTSTLVSWTVKNIGQGAIEDGYWYDYVYLLQIQDTIMAILD